jgi:Ca2+-binding RTX toxin-like protein
MRLSRTGLALLTFGAVAAVATPAHAATNGVVAVVSSTVIEYPAVSGRTNNVVLTRSGNTITVDDTTAIRPGSGCARVDSTKVRCTTRTAPTMVRVILGDGNDSVTNKADIVLAASGGTGNDKILGGPRADILNGGAGADTIGGLAGNDRINGESGNDYLSASAGDDQVNGGEGNDRLFGSDGNDHLSGDAGDDIEDGGNGDDFFEQVVEESPHVTDADRFIGGAGLDVMFYALREKPVIADLDGASRDDGYAGEHDSIGSDIESIYGGNGNDRLTGNGHSEMLYGGNGNDVLAGNGGNDYLEGGPGNDYLSGAAGNDTLLGGQGNDTLYGLSGVDTINGEAGNDRLYGTDGTAGDRINGGSNATATGDTCYRDATDIVSACERP